VLPEVNAGGANLLADFQTEYGAQLLGATVMRIRGYIYPQFATAAPTGDVVGQSAFGIIVEEDDELTEGGGVGNQPFERPHDDWLAWLPWSGVLSDAGPVGNLPATWNSHANFWAVDIKSARRIEELGQGLHLWADFSELPETDPSAVYDLSIGLKLP